MTRCVGMNRRAGWHTDNSGWSYRHFFAPIFMTHPIRIQRLLVSRKVVTVPPLVYSEIAIFHAMNSSFEQGYLQIVTPVLEESHSVRSCERGQNLLFARLPTVRIRCHIRLYDMVETVLRGDKLDLNWRTESVQTSFRNNFRILRATVLPTER